MQSGFKRIFGPLKKAKPPRLNVPHFLYLPTPNQAHNRKGSQGPQVPAGVQLWKLPHLPAHLSCWRYCLSSSLLVLAPSLGGRRFSWDHSHRPQTPLSQAGAVSAELGLWSLSLELEEKGVSVKAQAATYQPARLLPLHLPPPHPGGCLERWGTE